MSRRAFISATLSAALSAAVLMAGSGAVSAVEIKVLCAGALEPALTELIPKFEQSSGYKVTIEYGPAGLMANRIQNGEAVDVAIVTGTQIDALQKQGKVVAGSRIDIAKVGVGVFVRKGAQKPDISSVEAFKRAMLAAKSISYPDPAVGSPEGIYLTSLVERLGIADQMKPKTNISFKRPPERFEAVAKGDVEIGFNQISEILAAPSVELVGPLPAEIQNYTAFAAGIVASSQYTDDGKAFINFISSPAAVVVMKAKGFVAF